MGVTLEKEERDMTERFVDREANNGTGAEITSPVRWSIQFRTELSARYLARGVMETEDGKVYTFTVLREGHGDADYGNARRVADRTDLSFGTTAVLLLDCEREWIDPDLISGERGYQAQVDALRVMMGRALFWDRSAPYTGPNGYSTGRGEEVVDWKVKRAVYFATPRSGIQVGAGIVELADGRLYHVTTRREGREDVRSGSLELADRLFTGTFASWVSLAWATERDFVSPHDVARYAKHVEEIAGL